MRHIILNNTYVLIKGSDGDTFDGLLVGPHVITFQFTPLESSQPLCQPPHQFVIRPTSKCVTCLSSDLSFLSFKLFIQLQLTKTQLP